jgi:hypothetical protein
MMANLGLTTPDQLFTLPPSIASSMYADPENITSHKRPRSASSTPSPRRHKRQASLPTHCPQVQFHFSPARRFVFLITDPQKTEMKSAELDTLRPKPPLEGPRYPVEKKSVQTGYLVPSPPTTSGSTQSTASQPRQSAEKASEVYTGPAQTPAATQTQQNPSTSAQRASGTIRIQEETEHDPFEPREVYFEDHYEITPILKYFNQRNPVAQKEYMVLAPLVTSMLREMGYKSYAVTFMNVGYELESSRPCILVIVPEFADADAADVIEFVHSSPERQMITRAFAFNGSFNGLQLDTSAFRDYQRQPQPGSSIGSTAFPSSSFSMNCYFVDSNNDHNQLYSLTVHHGVSNAPQSIRLNAQPAITIHQPSDADRAASKEEFIQAIDDINDEEEPETPFPIEYQRRKEETLKAHQRDLKAHEELNVNFGSIVASSGLQHLVWNGRRHNEDWALITVNPDRYGINYMRTDYIKPTGRAWRPNNGYGQYLAGVGQIKVSDESRDDEVLRKWGRKTGVTTGPLSVCYSHVQLPWVDGETTEFTVTTPPHKMFSDRGDSGGPVLDMQNRLVGMVLGGTDGTPKLLVGHERLGLVHCTYITPMELLLVRVEEATRLRLAPVLVDLQEKIRDGEEISLPHYKVSKTAGSRD